MARGEERVTPPNDKKTEQVTVLGGGAVPEIKLPRREELSNAVVASAVESDTFEERPAAEPAIFGMVVETKLVHDNRAGGRVTLRAGQGQICPVAHQRMHEQKVTAGRF